MSVVISSAVVLAGGLGATADNPIIGYETRLSAGGVAATSEETRFPASNVVNPATYLFWRAASFAEDQYLTFSALGGDDFDYVGVAAHNFATAQIAVSIEGATAVDGMGVPIWTEIVQDSIPATDGPLLFRFEAGSFLGLRVRMQPGLAAPQVGVVYAGALLVLQRRIYVGHTPITLGRAAKVTNARSESGAFLGRIILNETRETSLALANLTPDWYRAFFDPFVVAAKTIPFFFAWRPGSYSSEVGYAWLTGDPRPANQLANGMMSVEFQMQGVA